MSKASMYHAGVRPLTVLRDKTLLQVLKLPDRALRALTGGATVLEGRTLDAQAQMLCFLAERFGAHMADVGYARARQQVEESAPTLAGAQIPMREVRDFDLGEGARARLYVPRSARQRGPLCVYFHGGGFVTGSVDSYDRVTRFIAERAGVRVLSVDYRRAPEHRFPAAVLDAARAYAWARENAGALGADVARYAVAGDSAGGNLAAVTAIAARDEGHALALQALLYPATDFTRALPSHRTFARSFFLDSRGIDHYLDAYSADPHDPRASVLFAKHLAGVAPAIVVTAGFDPLVDEGDAYAKRLTDAGVPTEHTRHDALIHGFASMIGALRAARHALGDFAIRMGDKLRGT